MYKKIIFFVMLTLSVSISIAQPSQYTPMTAQGYQFKRILTDSTLHLPSFCGIPTLRNSTAKNGALAIDTCSGKVYRWTNQSGWDEVGAGGIDSIYKSSDSVYYTKDGNTYFAFKDSTGGGGSQNLQDVTDAGASTTNTISIAKQFSTTQIGVESGTVETPINWEDNLTLGSFFRVQSDINVGYAPAISSNGWQGGNYDISAVNGPGNTPKLNINSTGDFLNISSIGSAEYVKFSPDQLKTGNAQGSASTRLKFANDQANNYTYIFSNYSKTVDSFYVPTTVNGVFADPTGDISITTIESLKRSSDSVYAYKNGSWVYQYIDSVGTGGGQNGRFGNDTATVVMAKVHNNSGVQLTNGKVVFLATSGTNSDAPSVRLANNKADSTSANTFGFVTGTIAVNDTGWVILSGKIEKLNTSAFSNGDIIYLDSISGQWTKSKPKAPYHLVYLGVVVKANAGNGSIFVKPQNGYELDEIHDVQINSVANNDIIAYESSTKLWKNKQISTVLGYTPIAPSDTATMLSNYAKTSAVNLKVNISDTANMLSNYAKTSAVNLKVNIADTANMLSNYAKTSAVNLKVNISDTANMLSNYVRNTPSVAYLSSDFNTSSTTGANSNLSIAVAANTAYRIMINGSASKATSSTGLKIGISAPTGTTIKANFNYCTNSINTQNNTFITAINTLYPAAANFSTAIATEMPFRIEGILVTGSTAGNIVLQGATVTSNTATIYANTLMTITKAYGQ